MVVAMVVVRVASLETQMADKLVGRMVVLMAGLKDDKDRRRY